MLEKLTHFSLKRPKTVIAVAVLVTLFFGLQFPKIAIDTDPENMLEADQPERLFYEEVKKDFGIHDLIVVGIRNTKGIFTPDSLRGIQEATDEIVKIPGVVVPDIISLTTTDNVRSEDNLLKIHPVMETIPKTDDDVARLRGQIAENPFLIEKIASKDGTSVAVYVPIKKKDQSYKIANQIKKIFEEKLPPGQQIHLAGLPVAEDTFGHEMFIQMAVVAPVAFMVILLLVFLLFRQKAFLLPIGMDAMFSVVWAMGLLIATGNTVHIMSSMIPVFLMPIAILDDVHILSEFFDHYRKLGDKRRALLEGMKPLYRPMLYTSLTSAVGFASLSLANIPPVRIFGLFIAFGIGAAWLFSMTVVPAVISLMSDEKLKIIITTEKCKRSRVLDLVLNPMAGWVTSKKVMILASGVLLLMISIVGVGRIQINDNPVKWFKEGHPLRIADTIMNQQFGGTYMAYLVVGSEEPDTMKRLDVLRYLDRLQIHLEGDPLVGKTSSVVDIVKRINFVLHQNDPIYDTIPDSSEAVGQFLFLFQSSGDPDDLDNFIDYEATKANIWLQLKGGDNKQMSRVEKRLADFLAINPLPDGISLKWSGLTYINKVWQDLMVFGMLKAVLASFIVVLILMAIEFRSMMIGILSMIPLTISILFSYGLVGWIGKDYDMPIAVCSALALGLGIDFAIHFLHRYKISFQKTKNFTSTAQVMFGEPGRAILRNAIVITFGFLPLMLSTLTPYVTVGSFFALLMVFSTLATLLLLPAICPFFKKQFLRGGVS
ncbi:MAG: hypothetical protein A3H42_02795 [Deltaproteobacteria bacterium RIFCSPLOWO2_02_FULL_46_8]|nr:MAG: hypothetical protein A3H42_02795 [Deltaproteobacteria bacterium RIFCSPLOWO2_02_FULL_46_8]